jgi:hypothetical protein
MTDEELKQLVESNARAAQAMLDTMAEERQERQDFRQAIMRLENVVERLINLQQRIDNLLASRKEH